MSNIASLQFLMALYCVAKFIQMVPNRHTAKIKKARSLNEHCINEVNSSGDKMP